MTGSVESTSQKPAAGSLYVVGFWFRWVRDRVQVRASACVAEGVDRQWCAAVIPW